MSMPESKIKTKNEKIKESLARTKTRRKEQVTRVIQLKIDYGRLSKAKKDALNLAYASAKHLYNDAIKSNDIWSYKPPSTVRVTLPDNTMENRDIVLGSQIKQGIVNQAKDNIKSLSTLRKHGYKTGALKPVHQIDSLPLNQKNVTYKLNKRHNRVKIQKIPGWLRLVGYDRLENWDEYGPAKLIRNPDGYYLAVTVFMDKTEYQAMRAAQAALHNIMVQGPRGYDAGSRVLLADDEGGVFNKEYPSHTRKAKYWSRRMSKRYDPGARKNTDLQSQGYVKAQRAYRKELLRTSREKTAVAREYVYYDLLKHDEIFLQDEQFASWKKRRSCFNMSLRMDASIVPRMYALYKIHEAQVTVLDKWQPTTRWCPVCGRRTPCPVTQRVFVCEYCGYSMERDTHGAQNMIRLGRRPLSYEELRKPRDVPVGPFMGISKQA